MAAEPEHPRTAAESRAACEAMGLMDRVREEARKAPPLSPDAIVLLRSLGLYQPRPAETARRAS